MRKESYSSQPLKVEVYPLDGATDIILRKNIEQVEKEDFQDGERRAYIVWECDETQYRYNGTTNKEEVEAKFDYWFALAEGKSQIDAINDQAKADEEPTIMERLEALESGMVELAEVICNG